MPTLKLTVLSLRYSSWSMRPWLALRHAGADFETETIELPHMTRPANTAAPTPMTERRARGSVNGLFPVLRVDGVPVHESLAICEYVADAFPEAGLWPDDALRRAQARAICCEMVSGFAAMRNEMSSHLFGRVPQFAPSPATQGDVDRVLDIWRECLDRSGGPFLFGAFGIADAMFYPVRGRLRTYSIPLPSDIEAYVRALDEQPAVRALVDVARTSPPLELYDDYLRRLGGDPVAGLAA